MLHRILARYYSKQAIATAWIASNSHATELCFQVPKKWQHIATINAYLEKQKIGTDTLSRNNNRAKLVNIQVEKQFCYQGYGSKLLKRTIDYCVTEDIHELKGLVIEDDITMLAE